MILKTGVAYSRKFLMVLSSDHISGATGKTVTIKLSKGPGAAGTTAAGAVTELDSTNLPGVYQVALTTSDTGSSGDLWYTCSASGCDNTDFKDEVQGQVFTDLSMNASGQVNVTSNLKQNQNFTVLFLMTLIGTTNVAPGMTVTGQRTFSSAGFSPVSGAIVEVGSPGNGGGWYIFSGLA